MTRLRIGIMGAGSIGAYVGGRLAAAGEDVVLVGRSWLADEIAAAGLSLQRFDGPVTTLAADEVTFVLDDAALADCDVVLVCVKSAHTAGVGDALAARLGRADVLVISLQNGVGNGEVLAAALPGHKVVPAIVGFNVVAESPARFRRTTGGPIVFPDDAALRPVAAALEGAGLEVEMQADVVAAQWTKLLINLNNAVIALCDTTTPGLIGDADARRVVARLVEEGLSVLRASGIRPRRIFGIPIGVLPRLLRLPTWVVRLVASTQLKPDPRARSSMWEDLTRGRRTEVEYLNGEIVRRAAEHGLRAPANERVVALVHAAEEAAQGPPGMTPAALWAQIDEACRAH